MNNKLVRTTILMDPNLVRLAKMKAASESLTLSKLISKLIAQHLKSGGVKELLGTIAISKEVIEENGKSTKHKGFFKGHP